MKLHKLSEQVLHYGSLFLVFVLPIIYWNYRLFPYISSKTFFLYGCVEILFFFWIYKIITDASYHLTKKQWLLFMPAFLYVAWMSIAGFFAVDTGIALWSSLGRGTGLLTLYHGLALALIITSLVKSKASYIKNLLYTTIISGSIVTLSVWFGDEGFNIPVRILERAGGGGLLGNSSLTAAYLMLILFFIFYILFNEITSRKIKRYLYVLVFLIICSPLFFNLLGLLKGGSFFGSARGATLGIIISIISGFFFYLSFSKKRAVQITGISSIIIGIVIFIVLWMKLMTPGTYINEKFTQFTLGNRLIFWDIAQKAIDEKPLLGYGPDNYYVAVQKYFNPELLSKNHAFEVWSDRAHNIYFDTGVSGGYPAILFYFLFYLSLIYGAYILYRENVINRKQFALLTGIIVGYLVQNLFVFDSLMSITTFFVISGIIFGSIRTKNTSQTTEIKEVYVQSTMVILFIMLCFTWYHFSYAPARKSALFGKIMSLELDKRPSRYLELLNGASVGNHRDVSGLAHDEYKLFASDPMKIKSDAKLLPYAQKDILAFAQYAEEVAKNNKNDYRLYLSIIHLYNTYIFMNDLPYDASLAGKILHYADIGKSLAPKDPEIYWNYAQIAAWKGDMNGVVSSYKQAIECDPQFEVSHKLLLSFLAEVVHDKKMYDEALANAKKNIPDFTMNN